VRKLRARCQLDAINANNVSIFMMHGSDNQPIQLPDRQAITLCEAVTAFVYGRAWDTAQRLLLRFARMGIGPVLTIEQSAKLDNLLERLNSAAYAGRIKFRALKIGKKYAADGHKDIEPLYFSQQRGFEWYCDTIWSRDPNESDHSTEDWHDVHLDREQFEALLRDMDVSVTQGPDAHVQRERKTFRTGAAGRSTSIHLVLKMAQRRLDAGDYPESLTMFCEQLAAELKATEPEAAPMTAKTMRNSAKLRELWRRRLPKIIDRS
jgi:hypothetical protein